jgi:hypothetical protein
MKKRGAERIRKRWYFPGRADLVDIDPADQGFGDGVPAWRAGASPKKIYFYPYFRRNGSRHIHKRFSSNFDASKGRAL